MERITVGMLKKEIDTVNRMLERRKCIYRFGLSRDIQGCHIVGQKKQSDGSWGTTENICTGTTRECYNAMRGALYAIWFLNAD